MEMTVTATEFKAKCLELFERLRTHKLDKVTVTKRGETVAVVNAPPSSLEAFRAEMQALRAGGYSVEVPEGFDWFAPVLDEPMDAELGILYR